MSVSSSVLELCRGILNAWMGEMCHGTNRFWSVILSIGPNESDDPVMSRIAFLFFKYEYDTSFLYLYVHCYSTRFYFVSGLE